MGHRHLRIGDQCSIAGSFLCPSNPLSKPQLGCLPLSAKPSLCFALEPGWSLCLPSPQDMAKHPLPSAPQCWLTFGDPSVQPADVEPITEVISGEAVASFPWLPELRLYGRTTKRRPHHKLTVARPVRCSRAQCRFPQDRRPQTTGSQGTIEGKSKYI